MNATGRTKRPLGFFRDERGYTLVEVMAAVGIAVVVGMGLYQVFTASQRSSSAQRLRNEVQSGCTFAMDQIKNELALGGYRAINSAQPISAAGAGSITFEYWDDRATPLADHSNNTQVTFRRATTAEGGPQAIKPGDLIRATMRYNTTTAVFDDLRQQVLAENVPALSFTYLQTDNALWSGVNLGAIRTIRTALTCESGRTGPEMKKKVEITLTSEVRARNVGVAATPQDTAPPATPTGVVVWDEGICGQLQVRWNGNTDPDLEGYIVYTGLGSGTFSRRTRLTRTPKATTGLFEYYTLTGLTSAKTTDPIGSPTQYSVAVQAFDKAGNMSVAISAPAGGNPTPSRRTEAEAAASGSDSTINPDLPPAPVLAATATPAADNSITLSWTPPAAAELLGYRLYRGVTAAFVPNDTPGTGNRIADETRIGPNEVSWVDDSSKPLPGGQLNGCQLYYYKICAVICDKTLVASYTTAQFSSASAIPTDLQKPPAPSITPIPGYKRIILNLTNPVRTGMGSTPDFTYTKIYFSTVDWLTIVNDVVMDGGAPARAIPDNGGQFTADGASGGTINFDDQLYPTPAGGITNPNLMTDKTYYFLAVSYDQCNNHSEVANQAKASADQCSDCDAAQGCLDAPYAPPNLRVDASAGNGCYGALTLSWDYPDSYVSQHPDFKAFRVLRRQGDTFTSGINETVLSDTWLDKTFSDSTSSGLQDGVVYSYRVEAYDCYYFEWMMDNSYIQPGNPPGNNISSVMFPPGSGGFATVDLNGVSLGRPLLEASRPVLTGSLAASPPSFNHNSVAFEIRNTSNAASSGRLRLDSFTATWDNPLAYLQKIEVGDDNTSPLTLAFDDASPTLTHGSLGSTVDFTTKPLLDALDTQIPFRSLFMNADRSVDRDTDMRANWIDYTLTYANPSTGASGCTSNNAIYTPLGPYIYSISQDKPYFGTLGWPVLGESGTNFMNGVIVPGGTDVNIFAEILDGSSVGIAAGQVRLFYYLDTAKVYTTAPPVTGAFPAGTNYASVAMTKVAGDQWRATIPATSDTNVWYFVAATDTQGNFDVDPEPWAGAYQYYQQAPDNCATIPNPPSSLVGTVSGGNVILAWTGPTTNATPSGSSYTDRGGFKVYRNRNDGTGWQLHYAGTIANPAATTFTDSAVYNLDVYRYDYRVTAFDLCTPTPNQSDPSNSWTETVESICSNTPNPPVLTGTSSDAGGSVTLTWTPPTTNAPPSLSPLTDLAGYQIWRQRETTTGAEAWMLLTTISNATQLTHTDFGPTSTGIRNNIFRYYLKAFDSCSPPKVSAGSNIYTENENNNPCTSFPNAPTALAGTATAAGVSLTWLAPTLNTDATVFGDAGGYRVERSGDGGGSWLEIGITDSATLAFFDASSTLLADFGLLSRDYRYRVSALDSCTPTPNVSPASNVYTETYVGDCGSVPSPPVILTAAGGSTSSAAGVTLKWTAPTTNAAPAGQPFTDPGGYRVYRRKDGGAWAKLGSDLTAGTFSYTDTEIADTPTIATIGNGVYTYYVSAIDTCAPPNESGASNLYDDTYSDACVGLTVPANPGTLSLVFQNANDTTGDLSWGAAAPAPGGYRVYGCSQADTGSVPVRTCSLVKINSPDPLTGITFTHALGAKVGAIEWFYAVKSLNKGSCADSSKWKESAGYNSNGILADPYR